MVDRRLRKEEVRAWLKSLPANFPVGEGCCAGDCPLARYLNERFGRDGHSICQGKYGTYGPDDNTWEEPTPDWATRFIYALDGRYADNVILAGEALAVLNSC